MIVDKVSDESFLSYEISEIEWCFKFLTNLGTNTDTGSGLLFSEVFHHILVGFFDHWRPIMWTDSDTQSEEKETIEIIYFCDSSNG